MEALSDIERSTSTYIRERGTWALRAKNVKRPFGGLNLVLSGDGWQFGPINASVVVDNPLMIPPLSALERIATMFWTREEDSFNGLLKDDAKIRASATYSKVRDTDA